MRWAVRRPRRASWYYALFNRSFDREHRSVLEGRLRWRESRSGPAHTTSLLRRNVHRLEKGLLMRPRREVFALDYIGETVEFYATSARVPEPRVPVEELQWAREVLTEYFAATASHPGIDSHRTRFAALVEREGGDGLIPASVPYRRDLDSPPSVRYADLLALARRRRSVRWFEPRPVPRELVEQAVAVAGQSPTACNRQPFYFHVFDDSDLVRRVASLPGGTVGFHEQFPAIVVLVGELRNFQEERDRHLIYIDASLAAMGFVYAAETMGLATCCINWPDIEESERRAGEVLRLEPDQRPIMFLAVGYPDREGLVAYSQKKPVHQLCRFNFE
jgi:nitroreductase